MKEIIIWDKDGTITASHDPNDKSDKASKYLSNVAELMHQAKYNFMISGFKSPESESRNFDVDVIIEKLTKIMEELPVSAAAFSPAIGGVECYVLVKKADNEYKLVEAHKLKQYQQYIGNFKKPGIGMFAVIKDIANDYFNIELNASNTIMIGDTWHDEEAATSFGLDFVDAVDVHAGKITNK